MRILPIFLMYFFLFPLPLFSQLTEAIETISIKLLSENYANTLDKTQVIAFVVDKDGTNTLAFIEDKQKILAAIETVAKLEATNKIQHQKRDRGLLLIDKKRIAHRIPLKLSGKFLTNNTISMSSDSEEKIISIDGSASTWENLVVKDIEYDAIIDLIRLHDSYFLFNTTKTTQQLAKLTFRDSNKNVKLAQTDPFWMDIILDRAKINYGSKDEYEKVLNDIGQVGLILEAIINRKMIYRDFKITSWVEISENEYNVEAQFIGDLQKDDDRFSIDSVFSSYEYQIDMIKKD